MVRMRILGLSVDSTAKTPILLLQEEGGSARVLPIWIGSMEAMSISLALSGKHLPRPLTHDLTMTLVDALGGTIESIEITNFDNGTFYADIVLRQGEKLQRVDCRPSDGVTLAVKLNMPIYVHPEVLENAIDAEQRQDAASFQALKDQEKATVVQREAPPVKKKGPRIQHVTMTVQPKAHVKTLIKGTEEGEDEADFEKLLKSLEPVSNTRM